MIANSQALVSAYKCGYSLRVTVPKPFFDYLAKVGYEHNKHEWPLLSFRVKDKSGKPYFTNYDFGFLLYLGDIASYERTGLGIYESGKNNANKYFSLPREIAKPLGIFDKTKLEVSI